MISFQYPQAFILLCILLGAVYALILYFRYSFIKEPTPGQQRLMYFLSGLRFLVITLIAILLLSPFIKSKFTEVQKPVVLVLQDNSESVNNIFSGDDSVSYANALQSFTARLKESFDVKEYAFDETLIPEINFSYTGKLTNISDNLSDLVGLYASQNVGAVVLATDGIYNKGANPLYTTANLKFPVFTVALGDTIPKRDLKISKTLYNQIVYLNDRFKIRVDVEADNFPSAKTAIDVFDYSEKNNPKRIDTKEVEFTPAKSFFSEEFVLDATKPGVQRFQVVLRPVEGEFTRVNNSMDLFIDVLDGRQKVLIAANSPHPDIAAIRQAIESNKNYEVTVKQAEEIASVKADDFDLIILHQLPSARFPAAGLFEQIKEKLIPALFIVGGQTALQSFNERQNTLQINRSSQGINEVTPSFSKDFSLFTLTDDLRRNLSDLPPLFVPFGQFNTSPGAKKLLFQKIGAVQTEYPLILFDDALGRKTAIIAGEGLWRWKIYDYRKNKNHEVFNELISKTVQYLAVKEDRRQFRVRMAKNVFYENEPVSFQAELYNDSYELINTPDVSITLVDEDGKEFPYIFNKTSNAYALDAGTFPVGSYTYRSSVNFGGKILTHEGKFTIVPVQLEAFNTVANHQLLYQLSENSGGKMVYPESLEALADELLSSNQMKPLLFATYKTESLINLWWLLLVFAGMLSMEWFIRKYEGGY